jgi:Cdc6-like AAA superfamily ATPase
MNDNLLEKVDFGHDEAENDRNLVRYFLETDSFLRIFKGDKMYVIGRKGTGKSAIYLTIENMHHPDILTSGLTFDNYSWQIHNRIRDTSKSVDFAYVNTWKYIILLELAKLLVKEGDSLQKSSSPDLKKLSDFLQKNYGSLKPSFKDFLVDKLSRIKKLELPSVSLEGVKGGGIEFEQSVTAENRLITDINIIDSELQEIILRTMSNNRYYFILFDKLDDGWDASNEFKSSMVGLLKAARDLNIESKNANKHLRTIVFLRSDIYDVLQYNDKNKAFADIEFLRWDKDKLITLINKRIAFSLELTDEKNAWYRIFEKDKMRSKTPNESYLIKRTFLRPRDIISFCRECLDEARRNKRNIITNEDIYNAENLYSERVYREFIDEMHKQHPYVEKLFSVLRAMKTERFNFQMFQNEYNKDLYRIEGSTPQDALKILFEYDIIGIQKIGGKRGGSTFDFSYIDPLINMDLSKEMVIHPALKKHLRLVEKRTYESVEPELGLYKKED